MKWNVLPLLALCACGDKATDSANTNNTEDTSAVQDTASEPATEASPATEPTTETNQTPEELGKELYDAKCAVCHGSDARGGSGPNIINASDTKFYRVIQNGDGPMPAFPELSDEEIDAIIAYIRSL